MSKYGYTGGYKRPVDPHMKGDPEGPSTEEWIRINRLADKKRLNFDPRFGGEAFKKATNIKKRKLRDRFPRTYTAGFVLFFVGLFYYPFVKFAIEAPQSPESREYQKTMREAYREKYGDRWWINWIV